MADHDNDTPATGKLLKSLTVTYQGWGDTAKEADDAMLDLMNAVNREYQAGKRFKTSEFFQINSEVDPGGGPGYLRPADVIIPGFKDD